jgi:predicted metal-dependent peptidase
MTTEVTGVRDRGAAEIVQCARAKVTYLRPYFSKAVYGATFIENPACPNFAIDEYWRLSYNPNWVKAQGIDIVTTAVLEKILHRVREHGERFREIGVTMATIDAAQAAGCCEIQDDLVEEIQKRRDLPMLPDEITILPTHFGMENGAVAEAYYMQLAGRLTGKAYQSVLTNTTASKPTKEDPPSPEAAAWRKVRRCRCGSGATGVHEEWEHEDPSNGGPHGLEDADRRDLIEHTAKDIIEYNGRKGIGSLPGSLLEWAKDQLKPKQIPWEAIVGAAVRRAIVQVAGTAYHSYARPSRRQSIFADIIMPGMRRSIPNIAIVGDTSGSMSAGAKSDLALVRGVVEDVCRSHGAAVAFLATDTEVHGGVQYVQAGRQVKLAGRGGTDLTVGLHAAYYQVKPRPDVIFVVTDCGTAWPAVPPPPPTRVVVLGVGQVADAWREAIPKWATYVNVDPRVNER